MKITNHNVTQQLYFVTYNHQLQFLRSLCYNFIDKIFDYIPWYSFVLDDHIEQLPRRSCIEGFPEISRVSLRPLAVDERLQLREVQRLVVDGAHEISGSS